MAVLVDKLAYVRVVALILRHLVVVLGRGGSKMLALLGWELQSASCRFGGLRGGCAFLPSLVTFAQLVEHVLSPGELRNLLREDGVLVCERIQSLDATMLELALMEIMINVVMRTRNIPSHRLGREVVCGPKAQDCADVVRKTMELVRVQVEQFQSRLVRSRGSWGR